MVEERDKRMGRWREEEGVMEREARDGQAWKERD